MHSIIIIGGPTASGKSTLALCIAQEMDAVIINADALQIYSRIPILSAQPSEEDKQKVEHQLYGVLTPEEHCSAGQWVTLARKVIDTAHQQGKTPIIVGGTGLYIKGLVEGLPAIPDIDPAVRSKVRTLHAEMGGEAFHGLLSASDPVMAARLHSGDSQRIMRAYEVLLQTGLSLATWQLQPPEQWYRPEQFKSWVIAPERTLLYRQCNERFGVMLERGAIDEVKALEDVAELSPVRKAIGVKELGHYIKGDNTLEEAITTAQTATRHYAKRQMTWFRHQLKDKRVIEFEDINQAKEQLYKEVITIPI
jgi:tRNA dimethylallyltransferase